VQTARFAPSTTGPTHPGTLLAALLCWLDARSRGARLVLRLEDLDPERCRPQWSAGMIEALGWLGLDWDERVLQSDLAAQHESALDRLAAAGLLYPCRCSRRELQALAAARPERGVAYPGTCRERSLPARGWRGTDEPLRLRLPAGRVEVTGEDGGDLSGEPAREQGDPIVRRRDGAFAYQLAGVVDDFHAGVTRVVRGRDLAPSTATQVALQRLLGYPTPSYRHHLLLLEERGGKLAKLHGAVGFDALRGAYEPSGLCGILALAVGLRERADPTTPRELLAGFDWLVVRGADRTLRWTGRELVVLG
jgi:glutamyl-Q tRNA(Asp) synthetase